MTPPSDNGTPPPIHTQPNVPTTQRVPKKIQPAKMSKSYQFWKIWPKFALSSSFFNSFWPIFDLFLNVQTQKRHNRLLVPRNQCYSSMEEGAHFDPVFWPFWSRKSPASVRHENCMQLCYWNCVPGMFPDCQATGEGKDFPRWNVWIIIHHFCPSLSNPLFCILVSKFP